MSWATWLLVVLAAALAVVRFTNGVIADVVTFAHYCCSAWRIVRGAPSMLSRRWEQRRLVRFSRRYSPRCVIPRCMISTHADTTPNLCAHLTVQFWPTHKAGDASIHQDFLRLRVYVRGQKDVFVEMRPVRQRYDIITLKSDSSPAQVEYTFLASVEDLTHLTGRVRCELIVDKVYLYVSEQETTHTPLIVVTDAVVKQEQEQCSVNTANPQS